jgi:2-oxoglutarate dehydrogenase E1 component
VLGFDYGYSLDYPEMLSSGRPSSATSPTARRSSSTSSSPPVSPSGNRTSGLVLLLPHGYEGQGPEHSSARLERFLQLCAEDNMQVANLTTPAQLFHALRRQMKREFRKPLIIMSPKSLLAIPPPSRNSRTSPSGSFQEIIDDPLPPAKKAERLILCSGKSTTT